MKNEETSGGDIHPYSIPPLFRGSIVVCRLPQCPGKALEQKESMTAWWYAVIRIRDGPSNTVTGWIGVLKYHLKKVF